MSTSADNIKLSQKAYLDKIALASKIVESVLKDHPELDKHDLFHIALKRFDTPEEKLAVGIRRRVIKNV